MFRKKEYIYMIRGEFIRGDGLVFPNNRTSYGAELLLAAALRGVATTLHMCLGKCNPKFDLDLNELNEPTIGTGGYARQSLSQDDTDWLTSGELNGERFLETRAVIFVPTGDGFDKEITRPVIVNHRSEEHTSELQSLMRISYAVFCLKKKTYQKTHK